MVAVSMSTTMTAMGAGTACAAGLRVGSIMGPTMALIACTNMAPD